MREFSFWAIIVTLLIFCIMVLSFMTVHLDKRIKEANAMIVRLEDKEKKREKHRIDPKPSGNDDGL